MPDVRDEFYQKHLTKFIPDRQSSILVCGGGIVDKMIIERCGFPNVTISNLDSRMESEQYAPFDWAFENAESLSYADNSFDYVVINAAIHHSYSPHRVLTEMYRVARKGVMAIESRDSVVMRLLERLNLTQVYEHAAVYYNDCKFGGANNTDIPNFVYRWTEREIEKTIKAYAPHARHNFHYGYGTSFPVTPALEQNGVTKYLILRLIQPFFWLFTKLFTRQQNLFAFYIEKPKLPDMLFPWITLSKENTVGFNVEWGHQKYKNRSDAGSGLKHV